MVGTRSRCAPRGLLGMLALVALVEALIVRAEPAINGVEPWDWRATGRAAASSPAVRAASVLCLGDSLVKLGVDPKALASGLGAGRSAYGLALCAGRAPASDFLLRRALAAGARPRAIVVDFNDSFLAEPPETTLRLYSELLRPVEAVELAGAMGRPDFASAVFAFQALPSARNRFEVRRAVLDLLAGSADFAGKRAAVGRLRRNWRAHDGGQATPRNPHPLPADPAAWAGGGPSAWRPDPTNAAYLDAFLARAEAHGIPVFWLLPPLHPGFAARRAELGTDAPVDAFVARALARFPGLTVVDGRRAGYDPSVFVDMAHLDRDGSARLTRDLAAAVAGALARCDGPRVVALPDAGAPAGRVAAEGTPVAR